MPVDLKRVQAVFLAVADEANAAGRAGLLDRECGSDAELRRRVETLLKAHDAPGSFLERSSAMPNTVDEVLPGQRADPAPLGVEGPGTVIGKYKLLEQIGEGGMGTVFMAEQTQPVHRKVALKAIKPGMDSAQVIARFEAERQALALMDHPNIAHVFDGGETASGRPYFVMELVRGIPITDFCDRNHLSVRERLELFLSVCQAVQHAHQKGVIHRDLKPSNVLVTLHDDKAVVKVIDFGIAKATGSQLTERTLFTNFSQMVGTPLYMSPEQAQMSGLDVDTRSDIYSLGVLLYELLTGTTPFDKERLGSAGYDEMRRIIREEEPARPSTRMSTLGQAAATVSANRQSDPKRIGKLLRVELDWVVMKALEKDRKRRYESASAFAADVQRYLNDEPVQACPPSAWYRFRKFARRNRAGVLTATSLAVGLLLAVGSLVCAVLLQAASNSQIKDEQKQTNEALARELQANDSLVKSIEREARSSYYQSVQLADRELSANNTGRAEELLDGCPLRLRGWEWDYLKRRRYQEPLTFRGHRSAVTGVAFSPDGRTIASSSSVWGGALGEIKIWERTTGKVVHTLLGHLLPASGVAFRPDGKHLASAGWDKTVKVWDVATGKLLRTLRGHGEYVSRVAYSPNGKFLASSSGDRTAKIWDAATFQELRTLHGHSGGLLSIAFGPGSRVASASTDGTVKVWDGATGEEVFTCRGHAGPVTEVAFRGDGQRLASVGFDGSAKVWDAATGRHLETIHAHSILTTSVAFSANGERLAIGSWEKTIKLWDLVSNNEALTLRGHDELVSCVSFSPDGLQLVSSGLDGIVKVWDASLRDPKTGLEILTLRGHTGAATSVAFGPDSRQLASASLDETVRLWDVTSGDELIVLRGHAGPVSQLMFSGDGRRFASADSTGTIKVWDAKTNRAVRTLHGFAGTMALSRDGRRLASTLEGAIVKVWDTTTGKEELSFSAHDAPIFFVAISPDGRRLATASWDETTKVWDATNGRLLHTLRGHNRTVHSVGFSEDSKRLATASWDKTAKIWDLATGKELHTLRGHDDRVLCVAFSPNGKRLATASWDNTVKIWDAATGNEVATLRGHTGYVLSVAFSPNGKLLASASGYRGKGEVKIWDATQWDKKPDR